MMPLSIPFSQRTVLIAAFATVPFLAMVVLLSGANVSALFSRAPAADAANTSPANTVYLSPEASSSAPVTVKPSPLAEIHIANNGLTLVRGARIIAISGNTLRVSADLPVMHILWDVRVIGGTKLFGPTGEKQGLSDMQVGDIITVTGALSGNTNDPAIDAQFVTVQ